jgi:RNA polymerase sigma-70 factor (ECF subfamily)
MMLAEAMMGDTSPDRGRASVEREAILRAQHGEVDAFEVVVARYQEGLRSYMAMRAPDPGYADDLAQAAFITAYEELPNFDSAREFGPWLFGIARNLVRREWESSARKEAHASRLQAFVLERLAERATEPEEDASAATGLADALASCLEKLPERWSMIVRLHYAEGCDLDAIAKGLGNARSTVGVTLFRIRRKLKQCIELTLAAEGAA